MPVVEDEATLPDDEAARNFRVLFNSETLAIAITDKQGVISYWSRGAETLFGYERGEIEGQSISKLVRKNEHEIIVKYIQNAPGLSSPGNEDEGRSQEKETREFIGINKDGIHFPFELELAPVARAKSYYHIAIFDDLTDKKTPDRALLKSETFFRLVYDHNTDIMILADKNMAIIWSNAAWYRGLGYKPGDQGTPFDRVHGEDKERVERAWKNMVEQGVEFQDTVYRYKNAAGEYVYLESSVQNLQGEPYYYIRSHNITTRKKLEESVALKTEYLEITLTISNLLADASDLEGVSQIIRDKLGFRAVFILLLSPASSIWTVFKRLKIPKTLTEEEIQTLKTHRDGNHENLSRFLRVVAEEQTQGQSLIAPLINSQGGRLGFLFMVKYPGNRFSQDEIGLIQNLTNTISLVVERQHYMEELRLRANLDKGRADFSDRLLKCRSEEEVFDLSLEFLETTYGVVNGAVLLKRDGRFVFIKVRYKHGSEEEKKIIDLLQEDCYIPSDIDNFLIRSYQDSKTKVMFFDSLDQVFTGIKCRNTRVNIEKRIKKLFKGMSLPKDQRIVAVKLPDLGIIFGFQKTGLVSEEDRSLEPIVNTISTVIKELRVERTREKIRRRNELIRDLNMELYKIPMGTLKKKLQMILPKLVKFIDADQIVIFMPESQLNDTLEIMIAFGRFNRQLKEVNLAVAQHVYHTGEEVHLSFQPEQSEQPEQDIPVSLSSDLQRRIETMYTGFFAAPICVDISRKRDILGVLIIGSREIISQDEHYLVFDLMNLISGQIKDELVYERERDLATKDELTKLDNRRSFLRRAEELFKISKRYGKRFSLTMIDIDFFKEVNDSYGHEAGDKALIALANIFRKHVREVDVLGRYGGEEFIMLFPETDMNGAVKISERIRKAVDKMEVPYEDKKIRFTISSGISTFGENSRYFQGVGYQVSMEGGKCTIRMNGKKVASIRLKMEDIEDEKLLERKLSVLFKKSLNGEQKRRHIHNLLRRLTSLDGLIGIADGRLYTSKVQGRNRVTSGPW